MNHTEIHREQTITVIFPKVVPIPIDTCTQCGAEELLSCLAPRELIQVTNMIFPGETGKRPVVTVRDVLLCQDCDTIHKSNTFRQEFGS